MGARANLLQAKMGLMQALFDEDPLAVLCVDDILVGVADDTPPVPQTKAPKPVKAPRFLPITLKKATKESFCINFSWPAQQRAENGLCLCMDNGQGGILQPCFSWSEDEMKRHASSHGEVFDHIVTNLQPGQTYRLCLGVSVLVLCASSV